MLSNLSRGVGRAVQQQRQLWGKPCNARVIVETKIRVHTYVYSSSITFTAAVTVMLCMGSV